MNGKICKRLILLLDHETVLIYVVTEVLTIFFLIYPPKCASDFQLKNIYILVHFFFLIWEETEGVFILFFHKKIFFCLSGNSLELCQVVTKHN